MSSSKTSLTSSEPGWKPPAELISTTTLRGATLPTVPWDASTEAKLLQASPEENEVKLGHYLAHCGVFSMTEVYDHDMVATHVWCGSMPTQQGTRVFWFPKSAPKDKLTPIAEVLRRSCTPLSKRDIVKGLGKLMALTRNKTMDEDETVLTLELYTEKLMEYPADAVARAFDYWPEANVFFPAWKDLKTLVQAKCWQRLRMRALVERHIHV